MSAPRFYRRVQRCRKCGRITQAWVHNKRGEPGYTLVESWQQPCAFERYRERSRGWAERNSKHQRLLWAGRASRPGRYLRLQAAKRTEAEAARRAALQGVLL